MEKYDIIIVGAGIAGCGLAYNLKRSGYKGSVLIIDKEGIGNNDGYGSRITYKEIVKEYNLSFEHIYKGIKIGTTDKTHFILKKKFYFIDYKKSCKKLLNNSNSEFQQEEAVKLNDKILKTNKEEYNFKILIDCSGPHFFAKKLYKQKIPFRYWVGKTRILKNKLKDKNYFYYQFSNSGYFEDLYPLKNKTLQGDWQYTKKIDFKQIIPNKRNLYKKYISDPKMIQEKKAIIPCAPIFPLVHKNVVFLGNSFGNAVASSACGVKPTLDTSLILTQAIKRRDLRSYEKIWRKKYLDVYIKYLAAKYYTFHNPWYMKYIKKTVPWEKLAVNFGKHPEFFNQMFDGESRFEIPHDMKKIFPKSAPIFQLYYYLYLKLKYVLM